MLHRLACISVAAIVLAGCSASSMVTMMPVGDSITQGGSSWPTYRCFLDQMLTENGTAFDFVGRENEPYRYAPDDGSGGCPHEFDQDHQSMWGATIRQITAFTLPAVEELQPDVVLIHAGTNDIYGGTSVEDSVAQLEALITGIQEIVPDITLFVAQIIPCDAQDIPMVCADEELGPAFHHEVASMDRLSTDTSRVVVVDMRTGFEHSYLRDPYHQNAVGDEFMAKQWFDAIESAALD